MRKLVIMFCLAAAALIYVGASTTAHAYYYYNDYGFFNNGYGPYYDCNGQRCYIGPPYTYRRHHGRYYRVPGQYFYGPTGGYFHGYPYN
jgi:hypothetical protein